ncbi:sensor histidine kinase [Phormidium sp. CCY1219]|uniref:sensor histidine kinase n=1 Tax=Phormidium sp. CCY1219 TaxID=2886104 RepID=UPI002D1F3F8E|nr:ATP-binding protein [Phormidium sp. CCY1219]MEB3831083.1 response regulator [Phormidium sp. CCY1219]
MFRILLVDDNPDDRLLIIRELRREFSQIEIEQVIDREGLAQALEAMNFDVAITDYQLRWSTGMEVLQQIKQRDRFCPVVMFTNTGSQEIAVEAMKSGLDDYIIKSPKHFIRLPRAVKLATERAATERKAEALEVRLQFLLERLNVGVFRATLEGELLECNPTFLHLLGVSSLPEAREYATPTLELPAQTAKEKTEKRQIKLQRPDGSCIWVELSATTIEINNQTAIEGLLEEITPRKQADDAMQQLNQLLEQRVQERTAELQEVNEELKAFAYSASHDLQEPLRGIQGFSQALLEDCAAQVGDRGREYMHRIANSADRLEKMIGDLLDYSRITRSELPREPVELDAVLTEVLRRIETKQAARHAQIDLRRPLPSVVGHYPTLVQIIGNLLTNALKFVPPEPVPEVRIWAEERDGWVRLWVADNGMGIAPENQTRVFRVFERLHGVENYSGTGIGLALVRKGVDRLGGRVGVDSELGQGSRFWIELPAAS